MNQQPSVALRVSVGCAPNATAKGRTSLLAVLDLSGASRAVRGYIEGDGAFLPSSQWRGGTVTANGVPIARVSYNGRVWDLSGNEIPLHGAARVVAEVRS